MKINWKVLIVSVLSVVIVSIFGSLFTNRNWYEEIRPVISPPGFVFGIVWTVLYILIALAIYLSVTQSKAKTKKKIIWLFGINLVANALWSLFFFGMQNPFLAFIDLLIIWVTALLLLLLLLVKVNWKKIRLSSYLLLPYLLWVTYAGILNFLVLLKTGI